MEIHRLRLAADAPARRPNISPARCWQDPIIATEAPARLVCNRVSFEPGARTAWHTHPLGQTLYVISGVGRVQAKGGPIREIRPGDVVWIPPGEKHWHGASPTNGMTHIAMQEALDGSLRDLDGARHRRGYHVAPHGCALSIRCAVHVPEHKAARQVPEPEVPERRPNRPRASCRSPVSRRCCRPRRRGPTPSPSRCSRRPDRC